METSTIIFLATSAVTVALAALVWFLRNRPESAEPMEYCRCSCCGQKMRYHASKHGQLARCPRCGSKEVLGDRPKTLRQPIQRVGEKLRTPMPMTRS